MEPVPQPRHRPRRAGMSQSADGTGSGAPGSTGKYGGVIDEQNDHPHPRLPRLGAAKIDPMRE
ncbi:hypothetical protein [Arthrobacter roseus]|uniref:hypothetical protein n=1 Tax=Arthrobacter roseus TaxID=136274 RepID=UPI001963E5D1|nr:hypothetical protein [Arthrobacter roseus]MBM7847622.1 hypothetical protein [Arthrobacter roseus]